LIAVAGEGMSERLEGLVGGRLANWTVVGGFALIFVSSTVSGQSLVDPPSAVCSAKYLSQTATVGQLVFKAYESKEDGGCLEVRNREGEIVFRRTKETYGQYTLGQAANEEFHAPKIENGTDVTGRGHPDMIVSLNTGGAHCCTSHFVFELEPEFRPLATLNDEDDDMAHFAKLDHGGPYYYFTADWTFAYWPASFASSPSHLVLLQFVDDGKGGAYHLALDKMTRPAPTQAQWKKHLSDVEEALSGNASLSGDLGATLWDTVLDLIYTGHSDLAWKFLDEAGPKAQQKPLPDLDDFCSILKESPYWPDLEKTIQNSPPACANSKPDPAYRKN
jgi:hypothetical protein